MFRESNGFSRRDLSLLSPGMLLALLYPKASAHAKEQKVSEFVKIVHYKALESTWSAFVAACQENAGHSRKEPGVVDFVYLRPSDEPYAFVVIESYHDVAASNAHQKTAHFLKFVQKSKELGITRSLLSGQEVDINTL